MGLADDAERQWRQFVEVVSIQPPYAVGLADDAERQWRRDAEAVDRLRICSWVYMTTPKGTGDAFVLS